MLDKPLETDHPRTESLSNKEKKNLGRRVGEFTHHFWRVTEFLLVFLKINSRGFLLRYLGNFVEFLKT